MPFRMGIVLCSIVVATAAVSGCATDGSSGGHTSYMERCTQNAKNEQERSECAWKNADRMAGGR